MESEGGSGGRGEREGRGCEREMGSECEGAGVKIKAEVANNRGRRWEGGKQRKEG